MKLKYAVTVHRYIALTGQQRHYTILAAISLYYYQGWDSGVTSFQSVRPLRGQAGQNQRFSSLPLTSTPKFQVGISKPSHFFSPIHPRAKMSRQHPGYNNEECRQSLGIAFIKEALQSATGRQPEVVLVYIKSIWQNSGGQDTRAAGAGSMLDSRFARGGQRWHNHQNPITRRYHFNHLHHQAHLLRPAALAWTIKFQRCRWPLL